MVVAVKGRVSPAALPGTTHGRISGSLYWIVTLTAPGAPPTVAFVSTVTTVLRSFVLSIGPSAFCATLEI